jgi:hypothetical protein
MPHVAQCRGERRMAVRYPQERPHGIAGGRRLEQALRILQQRRINLGE